MLLPMPSPSRTVGLLALVLVPASPGVLGCFAERCTDETDAELSGDEVTITLRNASNAAIFVPAAEGCDWHPLTIEASGDERKWFRGPCEWSCEDVLDSCSCGADCAAASAIRIEPGGTYDITWDRAFYVTEDLSLDCPVEGCPTRCYRRTVADDGDYRVSAAAGTICADEASCACPDDVDACELYVAIDSTTLAAEATLTLPGDSVELVFH